MAIRGNLHEEIVSLLEGYYMKLESAQIKNFRMLKEMDIDFEDVLSLVIGKNNSGKTSFLSILQKII